MPPLLRAIFAPLVAAMMLVGPILCCCAGAIVEVEKRGRSGGLGEERMVAAVACCFLQQSARETTASGVAIRADAAPAGMPAAECDCGGSMVLVSERHAELAPPPSGGAGLTLWWVEVPAKWGISTITILPPVSRVSGDSLPAPATLRSLSVLLLT